jgi:hypothetical protein
MTPAMNGLLSVVGKEDREEHDTLNKGGQNDGDGQDSTLGSWVTTGGFSGFCTDKAHADTCSKTCKTNVDVSAEAFSSEHFDKFKCHIIVMVCCCFLRPPRFAHGQIGERI